MLVGANRKEAPTCRATRNRMFRTISVLCHWSWWCPTVLLQTHLQFSAPKTKPTTRHIWPPQRKPRWLQVRTFLFCPVFIRHSREQSGTASRLWHWRAPRVVEDVEASTPTAAWLELHRQVLLSVWPFTQYRRTISWAGDLGTSKYLRFGIGL